MNINEEKRNQWQALKGMGFKAHWDYFWDYYKIHVIVGVVVLVTVITLVRDVVNQKPAAISVTLVNTASMQESAPLSAGFAEYENIDTSKYTVAIDSTATINLDSPDSYTVANSERIYGMIAASDLDVLMADPAVFENYAKNEMFLDLRDYYSKEELDALGDKVYYIDSAEFTSEYDEYLESQEGDGSNGAQAEKASESSTPSELIPVGISLENNPHLQALSYYPGEAPIVGLVIKSERTDAGKDFISYLLQ